MQKEYKEENELNEEEVSKEENELNREKSKSENIKKEIISWAKTIIGAVVFAYLLTHFVIVNAVVPTESMINTILAKDRIVAFRLSYLFSEPERYDIVVFEYPDDPEILYVKRVIGLPGDTVNIIDGKVYINDSKEPLNDDFIPEPMIGSFGPYTVPENCYFMLGDNRNDSKDSRYWENTFVEKEAIVGKVIFKYFPKPELLINK